MKLSDLVAAIDSERKHGNLSSAIRLFVLDHYRGKLPPSAEEVPERLRAEVTAVSDVQPER